MSSNANSYFRHQRKPLSAHIVGPSPRVLDIGCGAGYFGAYLKESGKARQVFGIELNEGAAQEAKSHLDAVECADLDALNVDGLYKKWGSPAFDYVVFADVLEHMKEPWQLLRQFRAWLAPGGKAIVSIPNVRHWSVVVPLLIKGRWDYQDAGIMDRTHLRFFTRSTGSELVEDAGYKICSVEPLIGGRWRLLSKASFGLLDQFLAIQFVIVARANP